MTFAEIGGHLFVMRLWSFWAAPGFWIQTVLNASSSSTISCIFDLSLPSDPQFPHLQQDDHKIWSWDFVRRPARCLVIRTAEEMQTPFSLSPLALFPSFFDKLLTSVCLGFPGSQMVKNLPAMQKTWVWSLGQEDTLEKGMATHCSILAWRIPWFAEMIQISLNTISSSSIF